MGEQFADGVRKEGQPRSGRDHVVLWYCCHDNYCLSEMGSNARASLRCGRKKDTFEAKELLVNY